MYGGERGIRTLDTIACIHAFQACAFDRSAISPYSSISYCIDNNMYVKIKIHLSLLILCFIFVSLSLFKNKLTLGTMWFKINSNSLVGFQKIFERFLDLEYFNNIFFFILNCNFFLLISFLPIFISFLIFIFFN